MSLELLPPLPPAVPVKSPLPSFLLLLCICIWIQAFQYALSNVVKPGDRLKLAMVIRPSISPVGDAISGGSLPIG